MKIGFLTGYSEERVRFAKKAGFDCLEISLGPRTNLDVRKLTRTKIEKMKETLEKNEIVISSLACYFVNHLDPDKVKRAENNHYFVEVLQICRTFGTSIVSTNTWGDSSKSPKENLAVYKEVFSEYAKIAEDNDVRVAVENCPHMSGYPFSIRNISYGPAIWELLFEEVPSKAIGLEYDPSHLVWLGIDYLKAIHDFGRRIFIVHAKDTEILKGRLQKEGTIGSDWWRYRLPGLGQIGWQKLIGALYSTGYKGDIIIEHEDPIFDKDKRNEGLKLGLKHLKLFVLEE